MRISGRAADDGCADIEMADASTKMNNNTDRFIIPPFVSVRP